MVLTPEARRLILDSGASAPSGDNLQPWTVEAETDRIRLSVDTSRDKSLYNFAFRPSLVALGAMAESMAIAARQFGLSTQMALSRGDARQPPACLLTFEQRELEPDPLFAAIEQRCTNRKAYARRPISGEVLDRLRAASQSPAAELTIIENRPDMRALARAASLNDRLLYESRRLHDRFYETIRWTEAEARATRDGLDIRTLELGPMGPGFRAMRSWPLVRFLNILGSSRTAPMHSYRLFLRSGAFGFLQMAEKKDEGYVHGGRALQRIWLTAAAEGLSFQPMAGMMCLLAQLESGVDSTLEEPQRAVVQRARTAFARVLPFDSAHVPILLFRLGHSAPPTARSLRRSV